jgi:hypothetical protein
MDNLLPVRRRALKSCHEKNSVHQFRGTGDEEMLLTAVFTLLSTSELIMLRGPFSSRSYLYSSSTRSSATKQQFIWMSKIYQFIANSLCVYNTGFFRLDLDTLEGILVSWSLAI